MTLEQLERALDAFDSSVDGGGHGIRVTMKGGGQYVGEYHAAKDGTIRLDIWEQWTVGNWSLSNVIAFVLIDEISAVELVHFHG